MTLVQNTPQNKSQKNALLKVQRMNRLYQFYYFLTEHQRFLQNLFFMHDEQTEQRQRQAINRRLATIGTNITYTRQQIKSITF